jgi:hypothetical protein
LRPPSSLEYKGYPPHRSLIRILPRSCCVRLQFLMPFLHSGHVKRLFSSVRPLRVLGAMSSFLASAARVPCLVPLLHSGPSLFRRRQTHCAVHNFSEDVSLAPCHCCTAGHFPAGGSQLLPGSTITSGQFRWLSTSPCS